MCEAPNLWLKYTTYVFRVLTCKHFVQIVSCKGTLTQNCYLYDIATNSWSLYSISSKANQYARGVVYKNKIYITGDKAEMSASAQVTYSEKT